MWCVARVTCLVNLIGSLDHQQNMFFQSCSHDTQHCAYFGMFYGRMALHSRDAITVFAAVATRPRADCSSMEERRCKSLTIFKKCNWITRSPPKYDTLLASWYPTYMQSLIISHSSCAEQYGDMSADTETHTLTRTQN